MRTYTIVCMAVCVILTMAMTGCKDKTSTIPAAPEPFELNVDSLDIEGEVDDLEVTEVDVDGDKWPVTACEFSGTADTTAKDKVEIEAEDASGNTGKKTIEIK